MLRNDFFEIRDTDFNENLLVSNISLNADHTIFEGHFPGNPVTPGVVQMQIVKEILETFFGKKLQLKTMGRCKFLNILSPQATQDLEVKIKIRGTENTLDISADGMNKENVFFKFNATYDYK